MSGLMEGSRLCLKRMDELSDISADCDVRAVSWCCALLLMLLNSKRCVAQTGAQRDRFILHINSMCREGGCDAIKE